MILPFLDGIASFLRAPITWSLLILHTLIMVVTLNPLKVVEKALDEDTRDDYYIMTQGRVYAQYIQSHPSQHTDVLQHLAELARAGNAQKTELLGSLALRNDRFLTEGVEVSYQGDQVAIDNWRSRVRTIHELQQSHPSFILGLNSEDLSVKKWLSYIFVHSGFAHFGGNMLCLMLFGSLLEPIIGGLALLVVFLLSGMAAAGSFLLISGATSAPLVGASGAVSGLMTLSCILLWNRPAPFLYFLFPARGYLGFVYLPIWVMLPFILLGDLAGYLSTVSEFGGVAYTAHLGGQAAGVLVGLIVYALRYRTRGEPAAGLVKLPPVLYEVGEMVPFIPADAKPSPRRSA